MNIVIRLQIYIMSFMVLLVIYAQLVKSSTRILLQSRLFRILILSSMLAIFTEGASWVFEGRPGQAARILSTAANCLLLSVNIVPLVMWTLYVDFQINNDLNRIKRSLLPYSALLLINLSFAVTAPINGLYFYIDAENFYHRGPFAPAAILIYFAFFLYNIFIVIKHWKHINQRNRMPLLLFSVPPLAGFFFQVSYYGTSFVWAGVSLSILMVYNTVQNQTISTDYLTGLYNRRQLDYYLESKIKNLTKNQKFSGIMIDIDNFKQINDKYGHLTGDRAIEASASILKQYFKHDEFIARYAGDEFVILLDLSEGMELEDIVDGLRKQIELFNAKNEEPYKLNFSMGYAIYDPYSSQSPDEFLDQLDKLMYECKALRNIR